MSGIHFQKVRKVGWGHGRNKTDHNLSIIVDIEQWMQGLHYTVLPIFAYI